MIFYKTIFFFILSIFAFYSVKAQNIAFNKKYQLSAKPNYPNSAPSSDTNSLTDGKYTTNRSFWNQTTTVGWQNKDVSITIDLNTVQPIGSVMFNSFRAIDASVFYPQNIFVFTSRDNLKLNYIGDAADVLENVSGGLQPKEFSLENISDSARYIIFYVIPKGVFVFCDEIQVFKDKFVGKSKIYPQVNKSLTQFVDSLKTPIISRRQLGRLKNEIDKSLIASNIQDKDITEIGNQISNSTPNSFKVVKSDLEKLNASNLRNKFNSPYVLEYFNNWDSFKVFHEPVQNVDILKYKCLIPIGGVQLRSFILTNSNVAPQTFTFKFTSSKNYRVEMYNVALVPVSYFDLVADPLLKITDSVVIEPGQSLMFSLKMNGIKQGVESSLITISSKLKTSTINLDCDVFNIFPSTNRELNANVWAYFNNPMIKGIEEVVAKDLKSHYVNTFVIPPSILPDLLMNGEQAFTDYLKNYKDSKNVLLFMDYSNPIWKNGYKGGQFMSSEWKINFINWYNKIKQLILDNSLLNSQIYLYPYDEIKDENINDYKSLISWVKNQIPEIKFYATLGTEANISQILPVINIAQIHTSFLVNNKLPNSTTEIWIYDGITPSRGLSPYGFYRLMAWNAFLNDYKGIGFWNYADERNGNKLNIPNSGNFNPLGSYSVIYNDTEGGIISSRRWEAFSLGVEDYSILQIYAKKFGDAQAKDLAKQVIINPDNLNLADSIRDNMLTELTQSDN